MGLSSSDLLFFVVSWYDSWLWKAAPVRQGCRPDDLLRLEQLTGADKNTCLRAGYYVPFHATVTDFHRINYRPLWFALTDKIIKAAIPYTHDSQTRFTLLTMRLPNGIQRLCLINFIALCHHSIKFTNWSKCRTIMYF